MNVMMSNPEIAAEQRVQASSDDANGVNADPFGVIKALRKQSRATPIGVRAECVDGQAASGAGDNDSDIEAECVQQQIRDGDTPEDQYKRQTATDILYEIENLGCGTVEERAAKRQRLYSIMPAPEVQSASELLDRG